MCYFREKKAKWGEGEKLDPGEVRERRCGEYDRNALYGYMKFPNNLLNIIFYKEYRFLKFSPELSYDTSYL